MLTSMISANCLQTFDENELPEKVDHLYQNLIQEYEKQRHVVDNNNIVEISYDELVESPLSTVKKIYDRLQLGDLENSIVAFMDFIAEESGYKAHNYQTNKVEH
jgi:hypothetical protein